MVSVSLRVCVCACVSVLYKKKTTSISMLPAMLKMNSTICLSSVFKIFKVDLKFTFLDSECVKISNELPQACLAHSNIERSSWICIWYQSYKMYCQYTWIVSLSISMWCECMATHLKTNSINIVINRMNHNDFLFLFVFRSSISC